MDMERVKDIARYSKLAEKGWAEVENPGSQSRKNKKIRAIVVPLLTLLWILLFSQIAGWKLSISQAGSSLTSFSFNYPTSSPSRLCFLEVI